MASHAPQKYLNWEHNQISQHHQISQQHQTFDNNTNYQQRLRRHGTMILDFMRRIDAYTGQYNDMHWLLEAFEFLEAFDFLTLQNSHSHSQNWQSPTHRYQQWSLYHPWPCYSTLLPLLLFLTQPSSSIAIIF
jgi:hypothetical protein